MLNFGEVEALSVLDKVRKWIDGESAELVLEEAARDAQIKPRSRAEEYIVKIARAIEGVMQDEMVPLPQGTAMIPTEYIIFLNAGDDREWQGVKRRGLEQGLYHILAERAREIAGKRKLETKSFAIELRIDGTLEKGEIRVQHGWEDSSSGKTGVLARPKSGSLDKPAAKPQSGQPAPRSASVYQAPSRSETPVFVSGSTSPNIIPRTMPQANIQQAEPLGEEAEVLTNVRKRVQELYSLEIWANGVRQNLVPIFNKQITIGRGSKSKPVDLPLSGDPEISRRHLTLITDGKGNFWAVNEGRNPAMMNNNELPHGQRVQLKPGSSIIVCSYVLRIQQR